MPGRTQTPSSAELAPAPAVSPSTSTTMPAQRPPTSEVFTSGPPAPRPPSRTLWEEGRQPGWHVVRTAAAVLLIATLLSLLFGDRIALLFDLAFVGVCLAAALLVRPRDFFTVGVLPPLLLAAVVLLLALLERGAVAKADDTLLQALVSGLAHHALALVIGYALVLIVLGLRQVALRHHGTLRRRAATR